MYCNFDLKTQSFSVGNRIFGPVTRISYFINEIRENYLTLLETKRLIRVLPKGLALLSSIKILLVFWTRCQLAVSEHKFSICKE